MTHPGKYQTNHLAACLRAASVGREHTRFAELADGRTVSYGEFFAGAERIAGALVAAGISPGDRVAVQVEKSLEAVQLYLATLLAGGVFLPFNTAYTAAEMAYFIGDSEPAALVCDPRKSDALDAIAVAVRFTLAADGTGTLREAADAAPDKFIAVPRDADDLAAILYTSGTTGRAKGAMLSHANLAANARVVADYWRFSAADILIHALPIFHTHGLFVALHIALVSAASLIFMPAFDAAEILKAMRRDRDRATAFMGVPTFYTRLLDCPELCREALADMRLFVSGSAPLPAEIHARWQAVTGHEILERYGMTETGMNISSPYHGERRAGSVGLPLPGVEVRITEAASGEEVPCGEVGVIEVRGANVFRGYWRRPEKTREELRDDGFFITGDLARVDAQGYVSIVGRAGDLIISGGYNVYPREVENCIDEITGVKESAIIGLPHTDFGECVVAIIVRDADAKLDEEEVRKNLKSKLANFKQPKQIFFTKQLPRNAMGKVLKNKLREQYQSQE